MKLLFVSILSLLILSCSKSKCKDETALNDRERSSCLYEFKTKIYFDQQTRNNLIFHQIDSLKYYIDNQLIITEEAIYLENDSQLGQIKSITHRDTSFNQSSEELLLVVKHDQDTIWNLLFKPRLELNQLIKLEY